MFCTSPGLSAPITAPISDNTAHLWLAIYVLNTCLQPVEVVYKHNYPSLVKLVYWFECKLGLCSPLSQSCWDLVQKSMAITFLNGRIIESFLPEIRLASWDNLGNRYVAVEQQHCLDLEHTYTPERPRGCHLHSSKPSGQHYALIITFRPSVSRIVSGGGLVQESSRGKLPSWLKS